MAAHAVGSKGWKDEKQQAQIASCGSSKDHQWKAPLSQENAVVGGASQQESKPMEEPVKLGIGSEVRKPRCNMDNSLKTKAIHKESGGLEASHCREHHTCERLKFFEP